MNNFISDTDNLSHLQIIDKLKLLEYKKFKRGALILFGKDPNRFYPNIQVKIGRFGKDSTDLKFQETIEGNLIHLLYEVQVQLNYKFLTRPVDFEGMHRIEKGEYPVAALREMLLNALVHRSYMGAPVQIRVFDDRLSVWNEGALPKGLDIISLKKEHNSRPRNPKIADTCFKAGYIDTWGRGTLKIINSCKEAELPEPEIIEIDGGVQVTIFKTQVGGQVGGQAGNKLITLTTRQGEVLKLIKSNPKISRKGIAQKLGINESAVQKHTDALKKKFVIEREGETTGRWIILVDE
ncbi:MAG: winged helix-turn-helix transcriptional regulator [Ferruginibacter sp.]|nr:winged helix-turn-helix transcriptional regulator [Ferruginibacter sp.]